MGELSRRPTVGEVFGASGSEAGKAGKSRVHPLSEQLPGGGAPGARLDRIDSRRSEQSLGGFESMFDSKGGLGERGSAGVPTWNPRASYQVGALDRRNGPKIQ
mmetsp:Transcript_5607/g.18986  ORF Transcript_5607/g.18986 Transcript_5607/m.18986 type:complete len:103 (+) Transcript_5607:303-611(+)